MNEYLVLGFIGALLFLWLISSTEQGINAMGSVDGGLRWLKQFRDRLDRQSVDQSNPLIFRMMCFLVAGVLTTVGVIVFIVALLFIVYGKMIRRIFVTYI